MKNNIIIALDGHSSCGKSTLAKSLAKALNYTYVDTGAMYRAVTLYLIQQDISVTDVEQVKAVLGDISIHFERIEGKNTTFLNGVNVEEEIRKMYVSDLVSPVATIPAVRRKLVQQQQEMGKNKGIVMDGRDIGTVVFPAAELKIFLTASAEERANRRYKELLEKGQEVSYEAILKNLQDRDRIDSTRADSPLKKAKDAIIIDNTLLSRDEQLVYTLKLAQQTIVKSQNDLSS